MVVSRRVKNLRHRDGELFRYGVAPRHQRCGVRRKGTGAETMTAAGKSDHDLRPEGRRHIRRQFKIAAGEGSDSRPVFGHVTMTMPIGRSLMRLSWRGRWPSATKIV